MEDTWAARELPVLAATVHLLEESYMVTVTDIAARTGLDEQAVARHSSAWPRLPAASAPWSTSGQ